MNKQYYYDCIDKAITLYWRALGSARNMELHTGDFEYVKSIDGEGPERIFNIKLEDENIENSIDALVNKIRDKDIPNSFLITPNTKPENLVELLLECGFEADASGLCMAMDLINHKSNGIPSANIEVKEVKDIDILKKWVHIINTALFECEIMSFEQFYDIYKLENTRFYLGYYDNIPASACFTIYDGIVGDLDMVATLQEFRSRGLASFTINKALNDLIKIGVKTVSLRAEIGGIALYKKLGFKEYCKRVSVSEVVKPNKEICATGEHITLEFAQLKDKKLIYEMLVSPEVKDIMFDEEHPAPSWEEFDEEPDSFFTGSLNEEGNYLLIKVDSEVIGSISYAFNEGKIKSAELDIWIASSRNLGKGFGSEAIKLVIEFVHSNYNISTFMIRPWIKNFYAIKAYKKCGFKEIEEFNPSDFYSDDDVDEYGEGDYGVDETINLIYQID